jgi:hypothetical protein
MTSTQKPRNYLSQYYAGIDRQEAPFRKVNLVARAVYSTAGVKTFSVMQVRIVGLSDTGAIIQSSMLDYLSDHFYLCLGDREIFITCAKRNAVNGDMVVAFAQREKPDFIAALARITFPLTTLKRLRGACGPVIEGRITRRHDN